MLLSPVVAKAAFRFKVDLLFIVTRIVCGGPVFVPCFVIHYIVSVYFCVHLDGRREGVLLCFNCLPDVL